MTKMISENEELERLIRRYKVLNDFIAEIPPHMRTLDYRDSSKDILGMHSYYNADDDYGDDDFFDGCSYAMMENEMINLGQIARSLDKGEYRTIRDILEYKNLNPILIVISNYFVYEYRHTVSVFKHRDSIDP